MHMHSHYTSIEGYKIMRTTIDLPNDLRQKLISESAARNQKGFSSIIVEALRNYFDLKGNGRKKAIQSLKGCMNEEEYLQELKRIDEGRANWRI